MSLLDAINDRISQLQAATDANYKAAGYEVPTSAQRKAAELTGQNPYEYATQLKQIETAQKEAEKAAKAAQKQAAKAARQSSSRSSSGSSRKSSKSSQSSSAESKSAPSGNTGAMSSLLGSESETIPSIKDSEQTKQEAAKAWASSRKKDSASKLVQASTAALQGVKFGNKKSENKGSKTEESTKKAVDQSEKEKKERKLSANESTGLSAMRDSSFQKSIGNDETKEEEPKKTTPEAPFQHGSMQSELFTFRNADMAVRKAQEEANKNPQNNFTGMVTGDLSENPINGPLPGLTDRSYTSNDHALSLDNQTSPILDPLNNALTLDPRTTEYEAPVVINKSNYTDYLGADRVLTNSEEKAANVFIDSYKKNHEKYEKVSKELKDLNDAVKSPWTRNYTDVGDEKRRIAEENGITWGELQEYQNIYALENKLSDMAALGAGLRRIDDNLLGLSYRVGDDLTQHVDRMLPDWLMSEEEKTERSHDRFERQMVDARNRSMAQATAAQNPISYGAGSFGYQAALTALSGGLLSGTGAVEYIGNMMGGSALAKALAETGLETLLVDIPTDTIPEAIENFNNGMPLDQIIANAGWNVLGNVGLNVVMDMGVPYLRGDFARAASDQADTLARSADDVIPGMNNADNILRTDTDDIDSLIRNAQNQFDTASNNLDDLSRQLQNSLDNQIDEPIRSVTDIPGAEPITVRQDIEGLQNQWDDYLKDISNETPGSLEVRAPKLDDYLQRTYESYMDDLAKATSNEDITEIMKKATHDFRASSLSPDQFQNLLKVALGDTGAAADAVADTAASTVMRKGLDTVVPDYNVSVGDMVTDYTDIMKQSVTDWGTRHADLISKNKNIKQSYDNLNKAVDDYIDAALHSDDNLDTYYRSIDNKRKKLSRDAMKVDEAAGKDKALGNSNVSILKNADRAKYAIDSNIKAPDNALDNMPGAEDLITEEVPKAIPNGTTSSLPEGATPDNLKLQTINGKKGKMYQVVSENGNVTTPVERKVYKSKAAAEEALNKYKSLAGGGSKSVPGANPMQFFGGGKTDTGGWKTGKWRTNTAEKTGKIKNPDDIPVKDYAYHEFTEEAQKKAFDQRYADVDDVVGELLKPDHPFDEVDVRGAQQEWAKLMDAGDEQSLKKANRLGRKIASETREGGRVVQALAESTRNTPEGQLRTAQKAVNEIVDKQVGEGTSESLDNLVRKIEDAYENSKGDKEAFKKQVEELMQGDIKQYASKSNAKKMAPKKISGKTDVLKMIEDGADIDDIAEVVYKQNGGIRLTPEDQKTVYDYLVKAQQEVEGSYAQEELLARAAKIVQAKTPSTVGDKVRSILYNNMLGNFKTAISRNAFGNLAYHGIEQARQPIAAFVDKLVSLKTGQHSALGWNKGKASAYAEGFKKGAKEQLTDISKRIDTGRSGAKGWAEALRNNATTWDDTKKIGQFANSVDYYVRNAMELGDRPFYEANYKQAFTEMTQMLDRYGQSGVYGLADVPESDVYEVMDMIASVRAADSVFQKHGKMSKGLTELRNGLGDMSRGALGVDILSTQSTPFTMTPGNMLERAIEYTPLGVVKNTAETLGEVLGKKGFNQRRFVDEASRTITGIPMLWGAYELASNTDPESVFGSINGSYSEDPDEKAAQREDGYIEYGYNVPNWVPYYGGKTLDTSDLPVIGPMMQAGARMAEEGIENPRAWAQAAESIFGGSTTQGLRRLFGSDTPSYSGSQSVMDNVLNTIGSSGSQLVPSLMRQTAQTTDPYKRDLGEYGTAEYYYNMLLNNIPGLRQTLPVKTDVEGQPVLQNQGRSLPEKILENYILPMNVSDYDPSTLNSEASRLYNETGSAIAFTPQVKRSDLRKVDEKQGVEYSEEQFREYKEDLGNLNSTMGNALIESDYYKSLSAEEQAKALQDVYTAMKAVANYNATKAETDNKIANAYMEGQEDAAIKQLQLSKVLSDYNISSSSKIVEDIAAAVTAGNYDEAVQIASQYREATDYLKDNGITNNEKNREMYNSGQATELEDSEEAKQILKDAGYGFGENSYTRDLYNEGGLPAVQGYIDDMNAFTNAGVDASNDLYKDYQAAAQYWQSQGNGDLTATQFANSVKVLDTDKSSHVSQAEVIAYANENGLSEAEVNQLWGLYGSEWSYVPYVTNKGTWAAHKGS